MCETLQAVLRIAAMPLVTHEFTALLSGMSRSGGADKSMFLGSGYFRNSEEVKLWLFLNQPPASDSLFPS